MTDSPKPYALYFVVGFMLGTLATGLLTLLVRDVALGWPVGARLAVALSPLVGGAAYGARVYTFGRAERLSLGRALRRGLPGRP